jgi:hypothetical protein
MSSPKPTSRICLNCGETHPNLSPQNEYSSNCLLITVRRHGRGLRETLPEATNVSISTIPIPVDATERERLGLWIWNRFNEVKEGNERERALIVRTNYVKGRLRVDSPIPWLAWSAAGGCSGQTRSKANFLVLWHRMTNSDAEQSLALNTRGMTVCWLSFAIFPVKAGDILKVGGRLRKAQPYSLYHPNWVPDGEKSFYFFSCPPRSVLVTNETPLNTAQQTELATQSASSKHGAEVSRSWEGSTSKS